jgi:hypothetical protein
MRRPFSLLTFVAVVALATSTPAWAIQAGITLDVHQDIYPQLYWPNDFHIEGLICSHDTPPVLLQHLDAIFPHFTYTITPIAGQECWYWFEATWWLDDGQYIPFCTVIHLGLLFDVEAANVIVDLTGWWTRNGMPVGNIYGGLHNRGFVPMVGFNVQDAQTPQMLTISNGQLGTLPPLPQPPVAPPAWPPVTAPVSIMKMDVVPFPPGAAPDFEQMFENGAQQGWPWVPIVYNDGTPISPGRPLPMAPDSFFDIFLESFGLRGSNVRPQTAITIQPGGFLVMRQLVQFTNNNGEQESRWFWEIHGAQPAEACCFADGHCEMLLPFTCAQRGGIAMGTGSSCNPNPCPVVVKGACCYGTTSIQCAVVDQITCQQQLLGTWKGPGTTCVDADGDSIADICEPAAPLGACCYGTTAPLCIVVDEITCAQQYLGTWKGAGTDCTDTDGDNVADICEPVIEPEACCLPDGTCQMLPPQQCAALQGQTHGPGSRCLGDHNANGTDDLCEVKWLQLPDLQTTGIDIKATKPLVLADDFLCTEKGLISEIVVWGSWWHDILPGNPTAVKFTLSIHADIPDPDGDGPAYSMPGQVLWVRDFLPGTYEARPYQANIQEGWWDPVGTTPYEFPGDTVCWMYAFHVPPFEAFCQLGAPNAPIVYWLDVQAEMLGTNDARFGWKTSPTHWNDKAVFGQGLEPYPGPWAPLRYPAQHPLEGQSIDLAFAVGGLLPCPKLCPGDGNCDGVINWRDIDYLIAGQNDNRSAWVAMFPTPGPTCLFLNLDTNGDGHVNWRDIDPFIALMNTTCRP